MTDEEIVRSVAEAVRGIEKEDLGLTMIRKISPGSNIWKVRCSTAGLETEFTLYIFPDTTTAELSEMIRERLHLHLPRWQTARA